jgi:intein/homing endonuclease
MAPPTKAIRIPRLTPELCELVGAVAGDGSIQNGKAGYRISLHGNLNKDYEYLGYLSRQIERLFGLKSELKTKPEMGWVYFTIYSKKLCEYFVENFGFDYGPKLQLKVPQLIRQKDEFMLAYIRGLFDTDGCLTVQKTRGYTYPMIKICTTSEQLAYSLSRFLRKRGIRCFVSIKRGSKKEWKTAYEVTSKGKDAPRVWMERIGSSNPRNIKKLEMWIKGGVAEI